jgi:hypothetical protein
MSEKWTPGPWTAQPVIREGEEIGCAFIVGGGLVGAAHAWPTEIDSGDFSRVEANAKLIAAAPDMAEAIQPLIDIAKAYAMLTYDRMGTARKAIQAGEAALAKTRGEAPNA